jgi:Na+-driven multidrug efflux pump
MNLSAIFNKIKADPFNKTLLSLSVPIIMQYFINSSLNLVDTIMIGRLGEASIAAVGFANVIYFLLIIGMFGISSGTSIFLAQFWGAKDIKSIKRIQGFSLVASLLIASAFTAAATLFPKSIIGIFSKDTQVIILGAKYIKIVWPSYILTAISICYATVLRSIEKVTLPTIASVVALGTNTILNWILIFGLIGFAPLGLKVRQLPHLSHGLLKRR